MYAACCFLFLLPPAGMSDAARVHILEQKLLHLRGWMSQLAAMMERSNMHAAQNARRLFVGGLPADITQVWMRVLP
jgi:hypothetical protein